MEWCLGHIDWLWHTLMVTVVFYEGEHQVTLVVILTLLCGSVNSPLSNQPGGKSQYPISRGGKHIRSCGLSLPPLLSITAALSMPSPRQHMHLCHSHARGAGRGSGLPGVAALLGAIVVYSQTPIIRTFKVSFYGRLTCAPPPCFSSRVFHPLWAFQSSLQNFLLLLFERQLM